MARQQLFLSKAGKDHKRKRGKEGRAKVFSSSWKAKDEEKRIFIWFQKKNR
jgi:hypothetical protein